MCDIPFGDNTFDIIISEDVLEHVKDYEKAIREIYRVLKSGGGHIFTVPLHEGRKTKSRENLVKVYHGDPLREEGCIVETDWGDDIVDTFKREGYKVDIDRKHIFYKPEEITDVDLTYEEYLSKRNCMEKYFKYNSIVIRAVKMEETNLEKGQQLFTGERFIPGIEDVRLKIEHYQRYVSVQKLVRDKVILDAACGEGYGSEILSRTAAYVNGIDISEETVERARLKYGERENLSFISGSIDRLPFEDGSIDVVVSFETIEHVGEELQDQFLKEIKRVLKPDGFVVMSTPNKAIYSDLFHYKNEFHVREFYRDEFVNFLGGEFSNIKLYNQYFEVASLIDAADGANGNVEYHKDNEAYPQEGKYYIAVAGNVELPSLSMASVFMNEKTEYQDMTSRILQLQDEVDVRNKHLLELDGEIKEKNDYILKLQKEASEAEEKNIKTKELLETEIHENIELKNEKVALEQAKEVLEQEKAGLEQEKAGLEQEKAGLEQEKVELEQKRETAEIEVVKRGEHIMKLDEELAALREYRIAAERELNSKAYRFGLKLRKMTAKFFPKGSMRRSLISIIIKTVRQPKLAVRICKPSRLAKIFKVLKKEGIEGVFKHYWRAEEAEKALLYPCANTNIKTDQSPEMPDLKDYEELWFEKYKEPLVSIVIPVYNQFDYTYKCLKSILNNSGKVSYEVIIADDNSNDLTMQMEERIHNIKKVRNKENLRFLLNCNNAAKYAKGKYVLFLNNDTQVQQNWLEPLVGLMEKDVSVGLVGSKLVYADGWLQEAGGIIWKDASAWNYGNRKQPEDAEYNYVKEVDYISGACIMIRKELWEKIGGFDERFAPAYYEDVDLAFEVRTHGYKVLYQPLSVVVHFEGVSNGTDISSGQKSYQAVNQAKFYEKWKDVLEKENFSNGENVFLAKDRSRFQKHILVVDHYVPHFDKDAGGRGTFMYLKMFKNMGMHVTFIGDNFYKHEPYTTLLNQEGIEILYGVYYLENYQQWIKENGKHFEYIYLQRPHIAVKYMDLVKKYTDAKIIYYDVDLCHVREMRQYEITKDKALLESAKKWKEIEFGLIEKADVVHVVGSYEEEYLKKYFPDKPIRNIPLYIYDDIKHGVDKNFDHRKDLLFVGGFGHPPNEDAVLWFAWNIFPKVLEKYPDIKWYVVGAKPPKSVQELASDNIIIKGYISDEELNDLYGRCRLDIVPLRYGAGVKGKVLEAIYNQIPLITTKIGAEGLSKEENAYWIADEAEKISKTINDVYEDYSELRRKSDNCISFIQNHFMFEQAKHIIELDMDC